MNGFTLGVRNGQPTFISKNSQTAGARERLQELKCGAAISPTAALRLPGCVCQMQVVIDHFRLPSPATEVPSMCLGLSPSHKAVFASLVLHTTDKGIS